MISRHLIETAFVIWITYPVWGSVYEYYFTDKHAAERAERRQWKRDQDAEYRAKAEARAMARRQRLNNFRARLIMPIRIVWTAWEWACVAMALPLLLCLALCVVALPIYAVQALIGHH